MTITLTLLVVYCALAYILFLDSLSVIHKLTFTLLGHRQDFVGWDNGIYINTCTIAISAIRFFEDDKANGERSKVNLDIVPPPLVYFCHKVIWDIIPPKAEYLQMAPTRPVYSP